MMRKTLGGDRLGSGKKMKVDLHGYERSTFDLSYLWRSTMSAGTLVPFLKQLALPGDTFDINLNCEINTHPTIGPLFGSFKVQLDVFQAPLRLYQGQLHNNKLGIGMDMASVKLPLMSLIVEPTPTPAPEGFDMDNSQINPSCILAYLGIRGAGYNGDDEVQTRHFNGVPLLAYWDIYKNYYANKQEEIGFAIHTPLLNVNETVNTIEIDNVELPSQPGTTFIPLTNGSQIVIAYTGTAPDVMTIMIIGDNDQPYAAGNLGAVNPGIGQITIEYDWVTWGDITVKNWRYLTPTEPQPGTPTITAFDLVNIDTMRERILAHSVNATPFSISIQDLEPYSWLTNTTDDSKACLQTQEGLGIKTYQSDLFNNWLQTEWIDGAGGINELSRIDVSGGYLQMDQLALAQKIYEMLNRIAVSGGSYDDWLDAVYTHERYTRCETPMYMGGLIRELVFQEVVSNAEAGAGGSGNQPLGTLAGKGVMSNKRKGGTVVVKVDEPSYIIGLISLTPRIDYSQGNDWDVNLMTMDDLHKPALDEIGFQELITDQIAWWDTVYTGPAADWTFKSAGKQPAWINYMTAVNKVYGNFAIPTNEMFMTLNRRYEYGGPGGISDMTTYIDPTKFNHIFAKTALDAQNYWVQISVDMNARRKMSSKIMPNL